MTYRKLPNSDTHNCFGCSPTNPYGLRMELHSDGNSISSRVTIPAYFSGWGRVVHGGILSSILDEVMGWTGLYMLRKVTLTKQMTVAFIKAAYVEDTLEAVGRISGTDGKRHAQIEGVVRNSSGEICATSEGEFTTLSTRLAIRLGIMSERQLHDFFEPLFRNASKDHA